MFSYQPIMKFIAVGGHRCPSKRGSKAPWGSIPGDQGEPAATAAALPAVCVRGGD